MESFGPRWLVHGGEHEQRWRSRGACTSRKDSAVTRDRERARYHPLLGNEIGEIAKTWLCREMIHEESVKPVRPHDDAAAYRKRRPPEWGQRNRAPVAPQCRTAVIAAIGGSGDGAVDILGRSAAIVSHDVAVIINVKRYSLAERTLCSVRPAKRSRSAGLAAPSVRRENSGRILGAHRRDDPDAVGCHRAIFQEGEFVRIVGRIFRMVLVTEMGGVQIVAVCREVVPTQGSVDACVAGAVVALRKGDVAL